MIKFEDETIKGIFDSYPTEVREKLLFIRELIFEVYDDTKLITTLTETLKWGEPSYVSDVGSTVRITKVNGSNLQFGIYFNCKTTLISTFKEIFGNQFVYSGNRGLIFDISNELNRDNIKHCIYLSLTYFSKN
ncbi:MAG: DUF1801 domain-containing protein [Candidatus Gracilibacteria bacterium]|nr:DUF1801 domain-containing protein [Candidatus Gracilibacteria bacterium]MDQ7023728.1 DUF1801 domain-containing protein [Candidatus Gracilibacteria bacterium]